MDKLKSKLQELEKGSEKRVSQLDKKIKDLESKITELKAAKPGENSFTSRFMAGIPQTKRQSKEAASSSSPSSSSSSAAPKSRTASPQRQPTQSTPHKVVVEEKSESPPSRKLSSRKLSSAKPKEVEANEPPQKVINTNPTLLANASINTNSVPVVSKNLSTKVEEKLETNLN